MYYVVGEITYEYQMHFLTESLRFGTSCREVCQLYSLHFSENERVPPLIAEYLYTSLVHRQCWHSVCGRCISCRCIAMETTPSFMTDSFQNWNVGCVHYTPWQFSHAPSRSVICQLQYILLFNIISSRSSKRTMDSLRILCQIVFGFHFFGFRNNNFFT
jgi:hypothetical protein